MVSDKGKRPYGSRARAIRMEGDLAYVPLTKGYEAVIDAADVHLVSGRNWCVSRARGKAYAVSRHKGGLLKMHRVIADAPDNMEVDHADGDGLHNTRKANGGNLRLATDSQNKCNIGIRSDNKTGFKGVSFVARKQKFGAMIGFQGKKTWLGYHDTAEAARDAYAKASAELHGEFGRLK